jgi:hypothetical protein
MARSRQWTLAAAVVLAAVLLFDQNSGLLKRALAEAGMAPESPGAPVVVELFTSQGCNSCPPADEFLGELAERPGVIALSMHVDYWDYIGWKDPYASPQSTARQRDYVKRLGLRYVYTPQMVIDGHADVAGLRRDEVLKTIEEAAEGRKALQVRFERADGGKIIVPAGHAPEGGAAVWLAVYDRSHETRVPRGENAGRKLRNYNVVRELSRIGTWRGARLEIPFDMTAAAAQGRDGCAVIVQQGPAGPVLGAAAVPLEALRP